MVFANPGNITRIDTIYRLVIKTIYIFLTTIWKNNTYIYNEYYTLVRFSVQTSWLTILKRSVMIIRLRIDIVVNLDTAAIAKNTANTLPGLRPIRFRIILGLCALMFPTKGSRRPGPRIHRWLRSRWEGNRAWTVAVDRIPNPSRRRKKCKVGQEMKSEKSIKLPKISCSPWTKRLAQNKRRKSTPIARKRYAFRVKKLILRLVPVAYACIRTIESCHVLMGVSRYKTYHSNHRTTQRRIRVVAWGSLEAGLSSNISLGRVNKNGDYLFVKSP